MQSGNLRLKNILVVRNDRFGEFLLNIPAIRALKQTFAGAKITAVTDPYVAELAKSIPFVDEVICRPIKPHSFRETFQFIRLLRKKRFDACVILNPSKDMHIATAFAGIPVRAGYSRKCGFLLTRRMEDKKCLGRKHEVEYNLEPVGLIGAKTTDLSLSLNINNDIIEQASRILQAMSVYPGSQSAGEAVEALIAVHPWTSDQVKLWPSANFLELAKRLTQKPGRKILIVGGKGEQGSSGIFSGLPGIFDLTGKTTLPQLAAILKMCRLLISGDSGPVHLACAVNTPVLALFRNDIPGKGPVRWGPWGKGNLVIEKSRLEDIGVDEVLMKANAILEGSGR